MVRVWKMRALAGSQVWDFTLRVKRGHFYHILRSRTHESNVFTPYSRCVHSSVRVGPGTVGGWFACERVMGSSGFSFFEVFSRILSLRGHVTVVGYGFWKITYKTGGKWVYNLKGTSNVDIGSWHFRGEMLDIYWKYTHIYLYTVYNVFSVYSIYW